ncbi:MAG: DUF3971 domain-containing protein [Alphaproteobacteria bacterium]|nr:MAG: DUF3971 domain-containing protein [Alphaproteobacteria bacterium]
MPERTENSSSSPDHSPDHPAGSSLREGNAVRLRISLRSRLARLTAVLALFLLVGIVLLAVRLSLAPLSLGPLRDRVLARVITSDSAWQVSSGPVRLQLRPGAGLLDLSCEDLVISRRDGRAHLDFPRLETRLSLWPLLLGRVDLRALRIPEAEVKWSWSAASLGESLRLAIARAASQTPQSGAAASSIAGSVLTSPEPGRLGELAGLLERIESLSAGGEAASARFSRLETLEIDHAQVVLIESGSSTRWNLPDARLIFAADRAGRSLSLRGDMFGSRGRLGELSLDVTLERKSRHRQIAMKAHDLRIADLVEAIPALSPLAGIAMPIDLTIHADAAGRRVLERANLRLVAGSGSLSLAPFYLRPRRFEHLAMAISLDVPAGRLRLDRFTASFGESRLHLSGDARLPRDNAPPELSYEGGFDRLAIHQLVAYWPDAVGQSARSWIASHIGEGRLADGKLRIHLGREAFEGERMPADTVILDFSFEGLKARYLPPMPPLEEAQGQGRLDLSKLVLDLSGGRIERVDAAGTRVLISRLDRPRPQMARIDLVLAGPIDSLLATLDSPPLGFPGRFGLAPLSVEGRANAAARLDFPLVKDLTLDGVQFSVDGEVADFRFHGFEDEGHKTLVSPRLAVQVARKGMTVRGPVKMAGLQADLEWDETFSPVPDAPSSRFRLKGGADLARIPFIAEDIAPYATGRGELDIELAGHGFDIVAARVSADLRGAALDLSTLSWKKPAGHPAQLSFQLTRQKSDDGGSGEKILSSVGILWRISELSFIAGTDQVAGEAEVLLASQADQEAASVGKGARPAAVVLRSLHVDPLRLGFTDASIQADTHPDEQGVPTLSASVLARSFDARGLLGELEVGRFSEEPGATGLALDLMADSVIGLNDVNFTAVEMSARRDRRSWHSARLRAADDRGAPIALDLAWSADCDCRRLTLTAEDAGRTLLGLGLFENARKGSLTVEAEMAPAEEERLSMSGLVQARNVMLVRRSALVKVLEKGKESGLDAYIGENGITFKEIRLPFRLDGPVLDLSDGRARGAQLGLTLEGQVNRATGEVNLNGLIVPAYALNSLLGKIPILGSIFTGGKGGGLFALSYRITGRIEDPKISVNPLTVLTPGILRKPFEGGKGHVSPPHGSQGPGGEKDKQTSPDKEEGNATKGGRRQQNLSDAPPGKAR